MGAFAVSWERALSNLRVLVADDSPDLRVLFETVLVIGGAKATLVADGLAAAACLRQANFDLVLLDAEMPGMGGLELCTRLRADGHDIPIIIVSGHVGKQAAQASLAAGASAHLDKPFTPDGLIACCRLALST